MSRQAADVHDTLSHEHYTVNQASYIFRDKRLFEILSVLEIKRLNGWMEYAKSTCHVSGSMFSLKLGANGGEEAV